MPACLLLLRARASAQANGDRGAYWRVLSDAGITRARLESFDRPIVCEPEWFPGKRDSLIKEMRNYLGILKAVHSGAGRRRGGARRRWRRRGNRGQRVVVVTRGVA